MLAQVFWDPAKSCSHAVLALFLFSKTGQKRQAGSCSSSLGNSLRTTKWEDVPWGQHDRPRGTPHYPHTFLSHAKCSAHLSVCSLFPFGSWSPEREGPASPGGLHQPQPSPPLPANPLLVPPARLLRSHEGRAWFWLTASFSVNTCSFWGG